MAREAGYADELSAPCEKMEGRKGSTSYEMKVPERSERYWPQNCAGGREWL